MEEYISKFTGQEIEEKLNDTLIIDFNYYNDIKSEDYDDLNTVIDSINNQSLTLLSKTNFDKLQSLENIKILIPNIESNIIISKIEFKFRYLLKNIDTNDVKTYFFEKNTWIDGFYCYLIPINTLFKYATNETYDEFISNFINGANENLKIPITKDDLYKNFEDINPDILIPFIQNITVNEELTSIDDLKQYCKENVAHNKEKEKIDNIQNINDLLLILQFPNFDYNPVLKVFLFISGEEINFNTYNIGESNQNTNDLKMLKQKWMLI